MNYKVVEIFTSINGEAQHAGELAIFVRFAGCNLNCNYCDTAWANCENVESQSMTACEIVDRIKEAGVCNVTLTGGEPLMQPGMKELITAIGSIDGIRIEIETNGSMSIAEYLDVPVRPAFTLDYKLPGSGMNGFMDTDNYKHVQSEDTVKFVVSSREGLECAKHIIEEYKLQGRCGLYLSPVFGRIEPAEIVAYMIEHKLNQVKIQLQMHKFIWNPNQKGV